MTLDTATQVAHTAQTNVIKALSRKWPYGNAHARVRRARGNPSGYACAHCPNQAQQWAYDHNDPEEKVDPQHKGLAYSDTVDHYLPLCLYCHWQFDHQPVVEP